MTNVKISNDYVEFMDSGTNYGRITGTSDGLITLTSNSGNVKISGVTNPTSAQDVATKDYVDGLALTAYGRSTTDVPSPQAIASGIVTVVNFPDVITSNMTYSSGVFTIGESGTYIITTGVRSFTTSLTNFRLRVNAGTNLYCVRGNNSGQSYVCSVVVDLNVADEVFMSVYGLGSGYTLYFGENLFRNTYICIERIKA